MRSVYNQLYVPWGMDSDGMCHKFELGETWDRMMNNPSVWEYDQGWKYDRWELRGSYVRR